MSEDLKVQIDKDGRIHPQNARLQRWLAKRTGLWQLVPTAENLLVFSRLTSSPRGSSAARAGQLQFTGSLDAMGGVMDVITFLNNTKRTGALVVLSDRIKKTLFFEEGDVRMATSNIPEDRLGALLFRFGMVTHEQLEEALAAQSGSRRLGRVLIEMNVITAHDLYTIIRRQVEEIFFSVLLMRTGVFYFYDLEQDKTLPQQLNLQTQNLLLDGVRRIDEMSYFRERIPHRHTVIERRADITPKQLVGLEKQIYDLVDGQRSVDEIARESRLGEFETTKVLFHLMQLGYVQKRRDTNITAVTLEREAGRSEADVRVIESFNTVFRKVFAKVRAKDDEATLRLGLDSFFQGATGFVELFQGVDLAEDGSLCTAAVLKNLSAIQVENRLDFLYNGLNELLFFEMFTAGEALPAEDEEQLQREINAIFQGTDGAEE